MLEALRALAQQPLAAGALARLEGLAWPVLREQLAAGKTPLEVEQALGVTPAVWVQFVRFPLTDAEVEEAACDQGHVGGGPSRDAEAERIPALTEL